MPPLPPSHLPIFSILIARLITHNPSASFLFFFSSPGCPSLGIFHSHCLLDLLDETYASCPRRPRHSFRSLVFSCAPLPPPFLGWLQNMSTSIGFPPLADILAPFSCAFPKRGSCLSFRVELISLTRAVRRFFFFPLLPRCTPSLEEVPSPRSDFCSDHSYIM